MGHSVLFYNLCYIKEDSIFKKLRDREIETDVIVTNKNNSFEEIRIRANYLQSYLSAREMILVRQHDYKRWSHDSLSNVIKDSFEIVEDLPSYKYTINIKNNDSKSERKCSSLLYGKDIVKPSSKPDYSLHSQ